MIMFLFAERLRSTFSSVAWNNVTINQCTLTLRLLMSYIYIYMKLLVEPEMLTSYIYMDLVQQIERDCFSVAKRRSIYIRG